MIELIDIKKSFGKKEVLKGVSTTFQAGKTNLLIGASGAGKTVLIKCMVGLLEVDNGNIKYCDQNFCHIFKDEKKEIRKEIGMLFQGSALFDSQTVEENVMFPINMSHPHMSYKEKLDRVNFCLERVNLPGSNQLFPAELSGGMMKRVGIARAIVNQPKYLFCDEPNSGLDPQTSIVIDNLIKEITEEFNTTTIINTHDMNSVMEIGDNIVFLYNGEKKWEGNRKTILDSGCKELDEFVFASKFLKNLRNK